MKTNEFSVEAGDTDANHNQMWEVRDRAGVFFGEFRSKREAQRWARMYNARHASPPNPGDSFADSATCHENSGDW